MKIRYLFKGVGVGPKTKNYLEKRIEKLKRFLDKISGIEIEVEKDKKNFFRVGITVKIPGKIYLSEKKSESIEGSLDMALEKIQQQIRKERGKIKVLKERGARSIKKKIVIDHKARF